MAVAANRLFRSMVPVLAGIALLAAPTGCLPDDRQIDDLERIKRLRSQLEDYYKTNDSFPESLDGFSPERSAWGHAFAYRSDGESYEVRSLGRDGRVNDCSTRTDICGDLDADSVATNKGWACFCSK
ncbi:MAG: hypothetical protein AAF680_00235 [Pseudomonadota bacterium]